MSGSADEPRPSGAGADPGAVPVDRPARDGARIGAWGGPTAGRLPPADTRRWVLKRKAEVVAAVRAGLISLEEACRRYTLSIEEFLAWQKLVDQGPPPRPERLAARRPRRGRKDVRQMDSVEVVDS